MNKTLILLVLVFALSMTLAGCGKPGPTTDLEVNMTEFTFTPAEFTIPAGEEITLTATNNGAVVHEFVIFKLGTDAGDHFGDEDEANIYWEMEALPGESKTLTFTAPGEPGAYYVTCRTEGHLEAGMSGEIIVVAE